MLCGTEFITYGEVRACILWSTHQFNFWHIWLLMDKVRGAKTVRMNGMVGKVLSKVTGFGDSWVRVHLQCGVCGVLCGLYLKGKKEMDGQKLERVYCERRYETLFSIWHWFNPRGCVMGVIGDTKGG